MLPGLAQALAGLEVCRRGERLDLLGSSEDPVSHEAADARLEPDNGQHGGKETNIPGVRASVNAENRIPLRRVS